MTGVALLGLLLLIVGVGASPSVTGTVLIAGGLVLIAGTIGRALARRGVR
jgi:hypothetical protein